MDTNPPMLLAVFAALLLAAVGGASAQTIYKQVDEEGRVIFTDQPAPGARTITSFETRARAPAPVENGEWANRAEASRRQLPRIVEPAGAEESPRRIADADPTTRPAAVAPGVTPNTAARGFESAPRNGTAIAAINSLPATGAGSRSNYGEAERAASTYTALNTPMAAQADALEAARRARQEATKNPNGGTVLVVQAAPRDQEAPAKKSGGLDSFYLMWAVTFFALAAGLLYVGWQVIRLILGTAFPRWQVGLG